LHPDLVGAIANAQAIHPTHNPLPPLVKGTAGAFLLFPCKKLRFTCLPLAQAGVLRFTGNNCKLQNENFKFAIRNLHFAI
jgi:hypothetical protein